MAYMSSIDAHNVHLEIMTGGEFLGHRLRCLGYLSVVEWTREGLAREMRWKVSEVTVLECIRKVFLSLRILSHGDQGGT